MEERELSAPIMFVFEPGEEHIFICSSGMILVGYTPTTFKPENLIPATHL
mgnify:FL=1